MRKKKALLNVFTSLILQLFVVAYGFVVPKVIITSFGSNVNGLVSSITQFLAYIKFLESGFGPVVKATLYKPIAEKKQEEIKNILKAAERFFRKIAIIFLIYIAILLVVYPLFINNSFDSLFTISLIIIISVSTFSEYFFGMTYKLFLNAKQKMYITSLIQIGTYALSILLVVLLAKLNCSIQVIKAVTGFVFVLRPLLQNWYVKRKYHINLKDADGSYKIKQKWDGLAQHIASVIHTNTDVTVLTFFSTLAEVSVYSVYSMVVKGIKSLMEAFTNGIAASFGDMIAKNEADNLKNKFDIYEVCYYTITCIIYSCTIVLIVPFISIYTKGVVDADYIRYLFGALIVISEYICAVRQPYSMLTHSAGHFKETRTGAWVEAGLNIIVSIIFVTKYGLIGVAIGTIVAMLVRTIEFIYHVNKYILKRNIFLTLKKVFVLVIETLIISFIYNYITVVEYSSYFNWIINALIIFAVAVFVVLVINGLFYHQQFKMIYSMFSKKIKKGSGHSE